MKKKLLNVVLCVAMTTSMLAGCGGNGSSGDAPAQEAPAETPDVQGKPAKRRRRRQREQRVVIRSVIPVPR